MSVHDYYINEKDQFVIEDYNRKKTFSSFLPAVSGLYGKPLWAYYVNRGQCMATFGVNNKDYAIMEFQPANKAYRQTSLQGFRTFIKVKNPGEADTFYEPFRVIPEGKHIQQKMKITSYDLQLEEENRDLGIRTGVMYCTLPGENIPALMRRVTFTNISDDPLVMVVADGMPALIPYYLINADMKNESNLRQAWMSADMEDGLAFYRIKALPYDTAETVLLKGGNFYLNFRFQNEKLDVAETITDPSLLFGNVTDLTCPAAFLKPDFFVPFSQVSVGYTPCGFGVRTIILQPGQTETMDTLIGSAPDLDHYKIFVKEKLHPGYMDAKMQENRELIEKTKRHAFTSSGSKALDLYMGQTFMDNYLRGGYPIRVGNGKHVLYVYSRKHGDLEREYNFFQVDATNYSQGNANFRDVNQNRRNDVYFFPFVRESGIRTFFNLLQLDGFNPLVLTGSRFTVKDKKQGEAVIRRYFSPEAAEKILPLTEKAFVPGTFLLELEKMDAVPRDGTMDAFLHELLSCCDKEDCAVFQEGYWVDHWTYNTDLLEQFMQVYPDAMEELMFLDKSFIYYDNDAVVVPRSQRYVLTEAGVRQYGAVQTLPEKTKLMAERTVFPSQVRNKKGRGDIYYCSLASKILVLLVNKVSSLDPAGIGVEMEGNKPGWCDALNGLPGILGSSINESAEIRRLAALLKDILEKASAEICIDVPTEAGEFMEQIQLLLQKGITGMAYWGKSNAAKEAYREAVYFGIDGEEMQLSKEMVTLFLQAVIDRVDQGLSKACNAETGVYDTYFISEAVSYELLKNSEGQPLLNKTGLPLVKVKEFRTRPIPPFLEGQVHMMRAKPEIAAKLHEAVKHSGMYDKKLDMFKVNADLTGETQELGRQHVFPRGWLENEAVFLHMEYKYFLELLRCGEYEEFYHYLKTVFVPFLDPAVYGRSILENSSFIVSSAHPDERLHGGGYVSRLTGASAEMLHMWRLMTVGSQPFLLDEQGNLLLQIAPRLPGWLFTEEEKQVSLYTKDGEMTFVQPKNTFAFMMAGEILTVLHNEARLDTWEEDAAVTRIELYRGNTLAAAFDGSRVLAPYANQIREGNMDRIEVYMGKQEK